jgi:IMP dehydrogenase
LLENNKGTATPTFLPVLMLLKFGLTYDDVLLIPKRSSLVSRKLVSTKTYLTSKIQLQIPIISANMDTVTESEMAISMAKLGGIGIIHRFLSVENQVREVEKVKGEGNLLVGAAVGVKNGFLERTQSLINAGADVIVVDIAHGHSDHAIQAIKDIKKKFPKCNLIAGNVATKEGTLDLIKAGADAVKVGVGPGSLCTTRIVTGCGIPQLTAVLDAVSVAGKYHIPVIADGGIKISGDITKALAAGASTVMLGSLLAGCHESPGTIIVKNNKKYKLIRGMASLKANIEKNKHEENGNGFGLSDYVAEGVEALVLYKSGVEEVICQLVGGLRSGMSYCGAENIEKLWKQAEFIQITNASLRESHPHDVELI